MMRQFVADFHVHSLLSPCAAIEMTPRNIVRTAARHGIDIIAITDHNACDNVAAALEAAKDSDVIVLPGMEVETKEEVHLIVLFEKMRQLKKWEKFVDSRRHDRQNDEQRFGAQFVVDAEDNFIKIKTEMLLTSLQASASEISSMAAALGGICIASHVDRPVYSIISQLGFIPDDVILDGVEVSRNTKISEAVNKFPGIGALPVITASDAHTIDDFVCGPKMCFFMEQPNLLEIRQALRGENLRRIVL